MTTAQKIGIQIFRAVLFLASGFLLAWNAHANPRQLASEVHPMVSQHTKAIAPSVTLNRYFETGGYETLSLQCRPERTEKSQWQCQIRRTRNGFDVAQTQVAFERTREWMETFFKGVERLERTPVSEPSSDSLHLRQALLGWEVGYDAQTTRGQLLRHQKSQRADVLKWILSLEGKLAAEFYRP